MLALPALPTMGTQLDLRTQGVEAPLAVIGVTVRAHPDGPGFRDADVDLYLTPEPLACAELARLGGWRDSEPA